MVRGTNANYSLARFRPINNCRFFVVATFYSSFFTSRSGQSCYESAVYQLTQREIIFFSLHEPQNTTTTPPLPPHIQCTMYKCTSSWIIESANKHLLFDYYLWSVLYVPSSHPQRKLCIDSWPLVRVNQSWMSTFLWFDRLSCSHTN